MNSYNNCQTSPQPQNEYIKKQQLKFFKKNSSQTALALLWDILFQNVLSFIFVILFLLIGIAFKGDYSINTLDDLISGSWLSGENIWVSTAFFLIISHICSALICMNRTGVKIKSVIKKPYRSSMPLILKCIPVMFLLNFVGGYFYTLINYLFNLIGINAGGNDSIVMPQSSVIGIVFYFIAVCIVAPIGEEFLFRGAILHSLRRYGTLFAAIISSLLFGLFHLNFQQMPMAFLLGMVFSYVVIKTGSIKASIILHAINNTVACIQEALYTFLPQYESLIYYSDLIFTAICFIAAVIIFILNFRRIKFVSDNPTSSQTDSIIAIYKPYRRYFSSVGVVITIIVCIIYVIAFTMSFV